MNSNQPPALNEFEKQVLIKELENRRAIMSIDSDKLWEYDWFADKAFEIALMALNTPPVADVVECSKPMTSNQAPALSPEIIDDLGNRYGEPEIPKCSICGGELSVQRAGGGSPTIWGCTGMIDDPTGERNWIYAEGRSMADDHYERSRWTDYRSGGDSDVIDLLNAYQALTNQPVSERYKLPDGWKLVPVTAFPSQWAAGQKAFDSAGINKVDAVYKAMVAAAPEVP